MGKPIRYIVGILVVLGVAFFLLTARRKELGGPQVAPPPAAAP